MKKMILTMLCGLVFSLTGSAQTPFFKDKCYASASLSGVSLTYNKNEDWKLGADFKGGYLFLDNLMIYGNVGYDYRKAGYNSFSAGTGLRYYFEENGLFFGAGANYVHEHCLDDIMPTIHVGYAYFLNRLVTIEPEVYYNQSLKDHNQYSGFGVRIGLGIYFE